MNVGFDRVYDSCSLSLSFFLTPSLSLYLSFFFPISHPSMAFSTLLLNVIYIVATNLAASRLALSRFSTVSAHVYFVTPNGCTRARCVTRMKRRPSCWYIESTTEGGGCCWFRRLHRCCYHLYIYMGEEGSRL
jgi:hypothetical protein